MIRRDRFEQLAPQLSTQGFKILLDIVATARGELRIKEIPFTFGSRLHGESKLEFHGGAGFPRPGAGEADPRRGVAALPAVRDGRLDRPGRAFRGAVHRAARVSCAVSGSAGLRRAARHDQQFHPEQFSHLSRPAAEGLCASCAACCCSIWSAASAWLANVGVAFSVYDQEPIWWLAGAAGALMGVVWNYAMSGLFVWRKR